MRKEEQCIENSVHEKWEWQKVPKSGQANAKVYAELRGEFALSGSDVAILIVPTA